MLNIPTLGLVPMTTKRNGMIMALLAVSILSVPVMFADALEDYLDVNSAKEIKVKTSPGFIEELKIKLDTSIPETGAFGYGMMAGNGQLIVATTHAGVYDSEAQTAPTIPVPPANAFSPKAVICDAADPGCGSEWHSHAVILTPNPGCVDNSVDMGVTKNANGDSIKRLSWQEPADKTEIKGKKHGELKIKDAPTGKIVYTNSLEDKDRNFKFNHYSGGPIVSFTIDIRNGAVCVDNIQAVGNIPLDHIEYKLKN